MVEAISASARAERVWLKIQRKPSSVVFTQPRRVAGDGTVTPESDLAAQTVRISQDSRATVVGGTAGDAPKHAVIVYGVKDHPDEDVLDSDIDEGYTFTWDDDTYQVVKVWPVPGGVQALAATG